MQKEKINQVEFITKDPVCGRDVSIEKAQSSQLNCVFGHKSYFFCSLKCFGIFRENPLEYSEGTISDDRVKILGICELCGKKMHKGEGIISFSTEGKVHLFCCPTCASVYLESA